MKIIISFALIFLSTNLIFAQTTIAASGGETTGLGGSSSFTVGQLLYTTNTDNNTHLAEGVQQAYEFKTLYISNPTFENNKISIYPNPTVDYFTIAIFENDQSNLNFTLFDITGRLITSGIFTSTRTKFQMQHLVNGIYFLKVSPQNQPDKTFKIIKI